MDKQYLNAEFDRFFEFSTEDKSQVSSVSAKLFAEHIAYPIEQDLAAARDEIERLKREDFSNERVQNDTYRLALKVANEQLAAAKAEIDALVKVLGDKGDTIREKDKQLAARDLMIKQIKEEIEAVASVIANDVPMEVIVQLSSTMLLQPTTEALDAYVQRAKEEVRDKCAAKCENPFMQGRDAYGTARNLAEAIKGMEL